MTKIKNNDFIEIEYTGSLKDEGTVFDTTDKKAAEENGLDENITDFGPIIVCVGENQILKGIDSFIEGKEPGEYELEIKPEEGFGKKDGKMIQLIPTSKFKKQQITPVPGLQINIDGMIGTIKTVTGGRTIVDFNHPFSGKDLHYKVKVNRIVEEAAEQIKSLLYLKYQLKDTEVAVEDTKATISSDVPKELQEMIKEDITRLTKVKDVEFGKKTEKIKKEKDNESSKGVTNA